MWPVVCYFNNFLGGFYLPGLLKFNILFLNILFVLIRIIPDSRFTGLNTIRNFTIRLFSVISRTRNRGEYPSAEEQSLFSTAQTTWQNNSRSRYILNYRLVDSNYNSISINQELRIEKERQTGFISVKFLVLISASASLS